MKKVYVGIPVTYIVMAISVFAISISQPGTWTSFGAFWLAFTSSLLMPSGIVLGSIVCTLGVSLVIWIPIWWIAGTLTLSLVPRVADILERNRSATIPLPVIPRQASPTQLAIANYIKKAENSGLSERAIINRLIANGWTEAEIERARVVTRNEQQ